MELLSVIRRWHFRAHFSIREISRRTGLSRNTVRKYVRAESVEPLFNVLERPSNLDPYADKLSAMLRVEAGKGRKQKRTIKQLHADLVILTILPNGSRSLVPAAWTNWNGAPASSPLAGADDAIPAASVGRLADLLQLSKVVEALHCAAAGTLSRHLLWRAAMQLNLAFPDLPTPSSLVLKSQAPAAWDQLDESARLAALERLASLIARMLAAAAAEETGHE